MAAVVSHIMPASRKSSDAVSATNGFDEILVALADGEGDLPEILECNIQLQFPGGRYRTITSVGWIEGDVDLAWIAGSIGGLIESRDYVILKHNDALECVPGMEVVAVGSPMDIGLEGTHTFGRISIVRNHQDSLGNNHRCFQIDAALNPGNGGGPLLGKSQNRFYWIGVNALASEAKAEASQLSWKSSALPIIWKSHQRSVG